MWSGRSGGSGGSGKSGGCLAFQTNPTYLTLQTFLTEPAFGTL